MSQTNIINDPFLLFTDWFNQAKNQRTVNFDAAALATATVDGKPSARIVLLKAHDQNGFVFYTNLNSRKSQELMANPYAALCIYWHELNKQIRIEGKIEPVTDKEADTYFDSRPRGSQIAAWSSSQSERLSSPDELVKIVQENEKKFADIKVPRPPFWSFT
jgi:pyridoxamine 5'-phosphate oxidase